MEWIQFTRLQFWFIKYILCCLEPLNSLWYYENDYKYNENDSISIKLNKDPQLSDQSQPDEHSHNYYASVRVAELWKINISCDWSVQSKNGHDYWIEVLGEELEVYDDRDK